MARENTNRVLSGDVPAFDPSLFSRWYVAVRDESGMRRGLMSIDQQMRRTDRAVSAAFGSAVARSAAGAASAATGSRSMLTRMSETLDRLLMKIPSPY